MLRTSTRHPALVASILPQVGVGAIASWAKHFLSLGSYNFFNSMEETVDVRRTTEKKQYYADRRRDALKYGSGGDYKPTKRSKN